VFEAKKKMFHLVSFDILQQQRSMTAGGGEMMSVLLRSQSVDTVVTPRSLEHLESSATKNTVTTQDEIAAHNTIASPVFPVELALHEVTKTLSTASSELFTPIMIIDPFDIDKERSQKSNNLVKLPSSSPSTPVPEVRVGVDPIEAILALNISSGGSPQPHISIDALGSIDFDLGGEEFGATLHSKYFSFAFFSCLIFIRRF
jgi:hypothetical protein